MAKPTTKKRGKDREPLRKIHEYALRISGSKDIEELTTNTHEAINTMIQPKFIVFGTVHFGVLRGTVYWPQSGSKGPLASEGMPLDGVGIMVRAIRTKKTCNVPDTRRDPDYVKLTETEDDEEHSLSELAVPVMAHGKAVGVLNIEDWEVNAYTGEDQEILEALAGYAGLALSRIRYEDRLKGLHSYASRIVSAQNVSEIADYTLDAMVNTLELEMCEFSSVQDGVLASILVKGLDETLQLREKSRLWSTDQRRVGLPELEFLSELEVPAMVDEDVVASLSARSIRSDAYSDQDKELLKTLASHVESAFQRIRLLEAQRQYEVKLEALNGHATELEKAKSMGEIADITANTMSKTLGFKQAGFGVVEGNVLKVILRWGYEVDPREYALDGPGIIVRAIRTGEIQMVPDIRLDDAYYGPPSMLSELVVPVKVEEVSVAVLYILSEEVDAFGIEDQRLLEILVNHVASAIRRIRVQGALRGLAYRLNNLVPGGCYISASHERCLKAYAVLSMEGVPGLCIIREDPQRLVENYGIMKEEVVLLSSRPFEDWETLEDLQSVSRRLSQFLESGEGVVLLDGLEYLISRFGFDAVYSFVQEKRFDFLRSKAVLLVPLEMNTLDLRQQALLSSEFTLLE